MTKILIKPESNAIPIKRIGFLGLSDYGIKYFNYLIQNKDFEIVYATSKSKRRDHSNRLERDIEQLCSENSIPYFGNINVNKCVDKFTKFDTDIVILGGYDAILKEEFLNKSSKYGVINTHFGIIPMNRGCNPSMWAVLQNVPQGFTTYFCTKDIDLPDSIIDICEVKTPDRCTSKHAYDLLSSEAVKRFPGVLKSLQTGIYDIPNMNTLKNVKEMGNNYHSQGIPNESYVSWNWKCHFIQRFSDSNLFEPYPTVRTVSSYSEDIWFKVECVTHIDYMNDKEITLYNKTATGEVVCINDNKFIVRATDGLVHCVSDSPIHRRLLNQVFTSIGDKGKHGIPLKFPGLYIDVKKM